MMIELYRASDTHAAGTNTRLLEIQVVAPGYIHRFAQENMFAHGEVDALDSATNFQLKTCTQADFDLSADILTLTGARTGYTQVGLPFFRVFQNGGATSGAASFQMTLILPFSQSMVRAVNVLYARAGEPYTAGQNILLTHADRVLW